MEQLQHAYQQKVSKTNLETTMEPPTAAMLKCALDEAVATAESISIRLLNTNRVIRRQDDCSDAVGPEPPQPDTFHEAMQVQLSRLQHTLFKIDKEFSMVEGYFGGRI